MTAPKVIIPQPTTIAYKAALILFKEGAMARSALMTALRVTTKSANIHTTIDNAIDNGWLVEDTRCNLDVSKRAFNHLSGCEPEPEPEPYVGIAAQPNTIDLMSRPPLSRKYIVSSHGFRDTIPEWSIRDHQSFRSA